MSFPKPPVELKGHCSVVHENTFYIHTGDAFLSLPLKLGGKWTTLRMGEPVSEASCTLGGVDGNPNEPGIYVIGGKSKSADFSGVQLYSLGDNKWRTLTLSANNTDIKNRVHHDVIYLTSISSLLVFAGNQDGSTNPSSQTFLISAAPPYTVEAFNSAVTPSVDPLLLPWRDDAAFMVGGGPDNTRTFTFSRIEGWRDTGVSLAKPLEAKSKTQCSMLIGADGSRVLIVFDVSKSPNSVSRYVILRAGGLPAAPGEEIGGRATGPSKRQRRDITLTNFPKYNNKNAPNITRNDFSLAQDRNGLVVISGGNDEEPLSIFDQAENSWVDTTELLLGVNRTLSSVPTTTSTFPSTSASIEPTSTSSSIGSSELISNTSNKRTLAIVGATLGAILGLAAVLIFILLFIGWRKRRNRFMKRGKNGYQEDKDRLSFQDQGMEPLTRSIQPIARGPVPSADSWAIMSGQLVDKPFQAATPAQPSPTLGLAEKETGRAPLRQIQTTNLPGQNSTPLSGDKEATRGDRRTDEGWSKYFQGENDTQICGSISPRSSASTLMSKSDYRNSGWPELSTDVTPLNVQTQNVGRVPSGSPSTEHPPKFGETLVIQQGLKAKISSGDSISVVSDYYEDDKYSSGVPASIHENSGWPSTGDQFSDDRVPSSNYSSSLYQTPGLSTQPRRERPITQWPTNDQEVSSSQTQDRSQPQKAANSDISWLNLGAAAR
ncbi:hypothetical protein GX48_03001 [Paracoccidioides brasiliensis]|nr:hypothetical protein GX48_03001 [Paracoccidioides brasiliensis]